MQIARTPDELRQVLDRSRAGFEVRRVPAVAATDWSLMEGALQHDSRGFFSVNGFRLGDGQERVLLYQPQGAVTGILTALMAGERCFLLQARAEPGCLGEAQFGPTVQSTPANFMRMHRGAATPYIDAFIAHALNVQFIDDTTQLDLGERYYYKSKRSILAETSAPEEPRPGFVWASCDALRDAVLQNACLNIDLRSILSIAAWNETGLWPRHEAVRGSLRADPRPDVIGEALAAVARASRAELRVIPLDAVANWMADEWGWREHAPRQGFAVEFFEVKAKLREKASWVQPLVNSSGEGHVALACRERGGVMEFLTTVAPETGLATAAALAPSYLRYPGAEKPAPDWLAHVKPWTATTESDEGGRFFRDASRYELVRLDDWRGETEGFWLNLAELKLMLRTSNLCTIQLRGVVSQLLGAA